MKGRPSPLSLAPSSRSWIGSTAGAVTDAKRGLRNIRRQPGFWLAVLIVLVVGIGFTATGLELAIAGRSHPSPVASPVGLDVPPPTTELLGPASIASNQASSRVWGGARVGRAEGTATIAEQQRTDLDLLLASLAAAAVVLLLVATVNLALLLGARGATRLEELSIRGVLGARRRRLVVQLLSEKLPLLLLACGLGASLTALLRSGLRARWPIGLQEWLTGGVDPTAAAVAFAVPLIATAGFGVLPALRIDLKSLAPAIRSGQRTTVGAAQADLRRRLSVLGVACSVALVVSAGLLFRSLDSAAGRAVVPYDTRDTLTFSVRIGSTDASAAARLQEDLLSSVADVEGVRSLAIATEGAFLGLGSTGPVHALTGNPVRPGITGSVRYAAVSPGAFASVGMLPLYGREFTPDDRGQATAVAVVNRTFAARYFFDSPIGRQVQLGRAHFATTWFTVIGVVEDVRPTGLGNPAEPQPMIFFSALQVPPGSLDVLARYDGDPALVQARIEQALLSAAPDAIVHFTSTLEERLSSFHQPLHWLSLLFGALAVLAALLAAYGQHGLIAFNVQRRTREIGIRIAVGAHPNAVVRMLVADGARTVARGGALGIAAALCIGRFMQHTLAGVDMFDPAVYLLALTLTGSVALVATYLPARSAANVDPARALVHE